MRFLTRRAEDEWALPSVSTRLKAIVEDASDFANDLYQWEFVITSILRTPEENDALYGGKGDHLAGVHTKGRGLDVRTRGVDEDAIVGVSGYINSKYVYDPGRPLMCVCLIEGVGYGSSAPHMHFQVFYSTAARFGSLQIEGLVN